MLSVPPVREVRRRGRRRRGVPLRKTSSAAAATTAMAAPIRKATRGPKSFHHTPKRTEAGSAARPTLA